VFVGPRSAFVPYFQALMIAETTELKSGFGGVRSGSDGGRTRVRHHVEIRAKMGLHTTDGRTTLLGAE